MEKYNGHIIIKDMPASRLFKTKSNIAVRVSLKCDKSPIGNADIYVHANCVSHSGGRDPDSRYDVLLIDDSYQVYYPMRNPKTGKAELNSNGEMLTPEMVYKMAERTKADCAKHPSGHKKGLFSKKPSRIDIDPFLVGNVTRDYLEGYTDPYEEFRK
ncbi:hypothetical protein J6A31_02600 [bacterium]|nr:hypothetical protein [bacterium]